MASLFGMTRLQAVHPKRLQAEWRELIGRHHKLSERRIQQIHSIEQVADDFFCPRGRLQACARLRAQGTVGKGRSHTGAAGRSSARG
jgi:hypothetical protein